MGRIYGFCMQLRKNYESRFLKILEAGMTTGEFKQAHPNIMLNTIFSAIRWLHDWYKPAKTIAPEQLEKDITQLLLEGLSQ